MMQNSVNGFDVSHHNGTFDFVGMANQGHKFCFLKATEGTGFVDSQFHRGWTEAPRAGLLVGAYHFFHPAQDPGAQAAHFLKTVGPTRLGDLPAVLDFEVTDNIRNGVQIQNALRFLQLIKSGTGKMPIVYGSPGFLEVYGSGLAALVTYPLWVAHYTTGHPRIPKPFLNYAFWQYTDKNGMDLNVFNGDLSALRTLAGIS